MKYKLVIFDFDGTLADSFPWALSIANVLAEKYQIRKFDFDEIESLRGLDARQLAKHYGVRWWRLPAMVKDVRELMARDSHKISLFEGVSDLLQKLSGENIKLALVTANSLENAQKILGAENFALFSYYECGVAIFGKTSKFKKILHRSGFPASEAICIGDEIRDIQAAQKARISACAVAWGYTRADALGAHSPDHIFTSMEEIARNIMR